MAKRKALKRDILKCKGFQVQPCFNCKRWDKTASDRLIVGFTTYRGMNNCEHYMH